MKNKYRNKPQKKKFILVLLAVLILLGAGVFALEKSGVIDLYKKPMPASNGQNSINYGPPTDEESKAGDAQKDITLNEESDRTKQDTPQTEKKSATVVITDAAEYDDVIEVRSFISNHYEDGTCTITFTQGSQTVSRQVSAYRDASTTICTNPLIKRADFPNNGDWNLTVSYNSPNATGKSESRKVTIQ